MIRAKTILLGSAALLAFGLWSRPFFVEVHSSTTTTSLIAQAPGSAILRARWAQTPELVPFAFAAEEEQPKPIDPTLRTIRKHLRKWLDAQQSGAEEEASPLIDELKPLLTDSNSAEIVQALTAEEQNTPFGLAALRRWMEIDPITASSWIAENPTATDDQIWVVARNWAEDSVGLQEYIDLLPDAGWKEKLLSAISSEALTCNPEAASKLAEQLRPGAVQLDIVRAIAGHWIDSDPNAALEWIAKVEDPALREQLIASAAKSSARLSLEVSR